MNILTAAILFSGVSFLIYGIRCIFTSSMVGEFARYNLAGWRVTTGVLEVVGGFALLAGLNWPVWACVGSGGLAVLMLLGFGVRMKIGDTLWVSSPAFFFMMLNAWIFFSTFGA